MSLIEDGAPVTVALSGGADSTALLRIMQSIGYDVRAMHVNHLLRGDESDRDERFCSELCKDLGVPFEAVRVDVRAYAEQKKLSIETAARELRYEALCKADTKYIATAHTLSDNAETVMLNLIRGTALSGLCGIPPVITKGGKCFIRPILCLDRSETEAAAQQYVTDSTNLEDDALRNRIRHKIMPLIRQENGRFDELVLKNGATLREEDRLLDELSENIDPCSCASLCGAKAPLASRAVKRMLEEHGLPVNLTYIEDILSLAKGQNPSAGIDVAGTRIYRRYDEIVVGRPDSGVIDEITLDIGENVLSDKSRLVLTQNNYKSNNLFTTFCIDRDKIKGVLTARSRITGDSVKTRGGTKTVKKAHIDNKVPKDKRHSMPVICDAERVVCAFGCGIDKDYEVSKDTKNIICIDYKGE